MSDQDPQTAIDYNLYPSSARPSGLHVPTDLEIKALKEQVESAKEALQGRLGDQPDCVVQACKEYVAAEDELPDTFDTEDYCLSHAVRSLVQQVESLEKQCREKEQEPSTGLEKYAKLQTELTAHTQALKVAKKLFQVAGCIDEKCGGKGWYEVVRPDRHGQPEQQQEQCQWCAERAELLATINNLLK